MGYKVKDLLESIFTGTARVNRRGSVIDNASHQERHLKEQGHEIISSKPSSVAGEHEIVSTKLGKTYTHTIKPHGDGKWSTISTKVQ